MHFLSDMIAPVRHLRLVWLLGWRDSALAHRRAILGVLWTPLQSIAMIGFILAVFGFDRGGADFPAHVAIGVVFYQFGMGFVNNGASALVSNSGLMLNIPLPPTIYVWRLLSRGMINLMLDIPVLVAVLWWVGILPSAGAVLHALAALAVAAFALVGLALALAVAAVRVRDVIPFVQAVSRILFFTTPIFWRLGEDSRFLRQIVHDYNPIARFLELIRDPLLGNPVNPDTYAACALIVALAWVIGMASYAMLRPRLAAWL